jgi:miniconductance mechanosensitive channel
MLDTLTVWLDWLSTHPQLQTLSACALLIAAAWLCTWLVKRILVRGLHRLLRHAGKGPLQDFGIIQRLSNIVPALLLSSGVLLIPGLSESLVAVVRNVSNAFIVLTIALALGALLDIINALHQRRSDAYLRPIKGYLQVLKILFYVIAAILMVATLIDRSPLILLSGLGAMAAVLMLIFQNTLLSLVASVQISSSDIVRVGDWVEMPRLNADGEVIDIALHTVKVQNWDKTITSIPTKLFISDPFKNWRGMQESGGRRMMRSLYLDQSSIGFLSPENIAHLQDFTLLGPYLKSKKSELLSWNGALDAGAQVPANTRRITNLGTFRVYIEHYLRQHPGINQDMTQMVRQLDPTANGLPLQLYCFTTSISWVPFETVQSDIFDHLLAILPEFGLRVFQSPSGSDLRGLSSHSPFSPPA